jgi:hypothetical protein
MHSPRPRAAPKLCAIAAGCIAWLCSGAELCAAPEPAGSAASTGEQREDASRAPVLHRPRGTYARLFASLAFGAGLRFNNPYRLSTQLGETGESLSLTAPFADVGAGAAFGAPDGIQQGVALRLSAALRGVAQQVLTPSYMLMYRGPHRLLGYGRVGTPWILSPDPNVGGELAAGGAFFVTAGLGVCGELTASVFYGAGTREVRYAVYPILSASLGVIADFEVLP